MMRQRRKQQQQHQHQQQQQEQLMGDATMTALIDRIQAMKKQERVHYTYEDYIRSSPSKPLSSDTRELVVWREKICKWTYNVIDHFELQRETVAISIDLFDRYIATCGNVCDGSSALLISLTTLYIAIKVHEKKKIKLLTLTQLSRGQFDARDIERMELRVLKALSWLVHPPVVVEFISNYLDLLPEITKSVRKKINELATYLAELSVCDPFFIEHNSCTVAFAAILNILDDSMSFDDVSRSSREHFFYDVHTHLGLNRKKSSVRLARIRLQTMLASSGAQYRQNKENQPTPSSRPRQSENVRDEIMRPSSGISRPVHSDNSRDELMRSANGNEDLRGTKGGSARFRADSHDSMSVGSRGSRSSRGSRGSKGTLKKLGLGFNRTGSSVTPY